MERNNKSCQIFVGFGTFWFTHSVKRIMVEIKLFNYCDRLTKIIIEKTPWVDQEQKQNWEGSLKMTLEMDINNSKGSFC